MNKIKTKPNTGSSRQAPPPPPPKKNKLKNKTKMSKEKEIKLLSKKEIKKHIDSLPYYGHCTDEYREGVEDGIEWVKEQIKNKTIMEDE